MERKLTVRIDGPGVEQGRIALRDLQRIIHPLEQALKALVPSPPTNQSARSDSRSQPVRFLLSGIDAGSAIAQGSLLIEATLAEPMFEHDPVDQLIKGLANEHPALPARAMRHIERLRRRLPEGVDSVEIEIAGLAEAAHLAPLEAVAPQGTHQAARSLSGRLMEINFLSRRAILEIPAARGRRTTRRIALRFSDESAGDMQRFARQLVVVDGMATIEERGAISEMEVSAISLQLDDRTAMWPAKKFHWPSPDERLANADMDEYLRSSQDVHEDEQ